MDTATFNRFAHLADTDPEAGVMYLTGHDFWDVKPKNFEDPWFKRIVKNVRTGLLDSLLLLCFQLLYVFHTHTRYFILTNDCCLFVCFFFAGEKYRYLSQEELPPGVEFGIAYTTGTVNKLHVSRHARNTKCP